MLRFFLVLVFALWLLPLGRFIALSEEAKACGGQRAICLCSKGLKVGQAKPLEGIVFQKTTPSPKSSSGTPSQYVSIRNFHKDHSIVLSQRFDAGEMLYRDPTLVVPEHIPLA